MVLRARQWPEKNLLQRSPLLRSVAYLGSMAAILETSFRVLKQLDLTDMSFHQVATPAVAAITYAFARLRSEDVAPWHRMPERYELTGFGKGLAYGSSAFAAALAIAAGKGWVSAPQWGWEQHGVGMVAQSVAALTLQHAMVAWNEEIVFRGYGFDTLRQAIGLPATIICTSLLFAVYHGLEPRLVANMVLAGVLLTLLRIESGNLWLPYGFHLGWNLIQVVVFGPATEGPAIRPLHIHGPEEWIGQPGQPEVGWLATLVVGLIICILTVRLWKRTHQAQPRDEICS